MNGGVVRCYYNNKCKKPFFLPGPPGTPGIQFRAFNNVISNLGYITFGLTFIGIVAWFDPDNYCRKRFRRRSNAVAGTAATETGLHKDYSLFYTLGIACVAEGFLSSFYHACPSALTFQLDVTMMFFAMGMSVLTFYVKRLPSRGAGPFKAFGSFLACVILNFLSHVLGTDIYARPVTAGLFWALAEFALVLIACTAIAHIWLTMHLTLNMHGDGRHVSVGHLTWQEQYRLMRRSWEPSVRIAAIREKRAMALLLTTEVIFLVLMAVAGPLLALDFFPWALSIELITFVLYLCYYVYQKLLSNERLANWLVIMVVANLFLWLLAFRLYAVKLLDYRLPPSASAEMNETCVLWGYFDVHDCWHFVSSAALFMHQLIMFLIDSDLSETPRKEIEAF